jgi:putative transposase
VQFQGATWQRCQMHLSANVSSAAPRAVQEELHARVRAIFEAPDLPTARTLLAQVVADFERAAPTAIVTLERGFDDATAVLALPRPYRQRLRTTNGQERLNEEGVGASAWSASSPTAGRASACWEPSSWSKMNSGAPARATWT